MNKAPFLFSYDAMGTHWSVSIWDDQSDGASSTLEQSIQHASSDFEQKYSRFIPSSIVRSLTQQRGVVAVPEDLVSMLRLYQKLYDATGGVCTPLVGRTLSDMGYNEEYTLQPADIIHAVPSFLDVLRIIDHNHIEILDEVHLDLGALGKGFFVDKISDMLRANSLQQYLVNGSGDIMYQGNGDTIRCGLEHPEDASKVIGVVELKEGSLCASSGMRRRWNKYHHTINPFTLESPDSILATWVIAKNAALADGLATCLFLVEPQQLHEQFSFEHCILNADFRISRSNGFMAELF